MSVATIAVLSTLTRARHPTSAPLGAMRAATAFAILHATMTLRRAAHGPARGADHRVMVGRMHAPAMRMSILRHDAEPLLGEVIDSILPRKTSS